MFHLRSTASRKNRRCGPRSRAGRYFSSPRSMPSLAMARSSRRFCFWSFVAPFVSATNGRRRAASASRRLGVGRPLPTLTCPKAVLPEARPASAGTGVASSDFLRNNTLPL